MGMAQYSQQNLIEELLHLCEDDVEGFLSHVIPAGFPPDVIQKATQPRVAYRLFCQRLGSLEQAKIDQILDALRRAFPGSDMLRPLSASMIRADRHGGQSRSHGDRTPGVETVPGEGEEDRELLPHEKRRIETLVGRQPDNKELHSCVRHGNETECWLRGQSLHMLAQLKRANEAMTETRDLVALLTKLHDKAIHLQSALASPRPDDPTILGRAYALKDAVSCIRGFFRDLKRGKNKWPPLRRLEEHLKRRLEGAGNPNASFNSEQTKNYITCIRRIHATLCGPRFNKKAETQEEQVALLRDARFVGVLETFRLYDPAAPDALRQVALTRGPATYDEISKQLRDAEPDLSDLDKHLAATSDQLPHERQEYLYIWSEGHRLEH